MKTMWIAHDKQDQWVTPQRLFDPSSRSSANASRKPVLRSFAQPKFLVVFEGCSGGAPHCAHADTGRNPFSPGRYSPDLLTLGDLVGSLRRLFSLIFFATSRSDFDRNSGRQETLISNRIARPPIQQIIQLQLRRLPPIRGRLDDIRREHGQLQNAAHMGRVHALDRARSSSVACTPVSHSCRYRNWPRQHFDHGVVDARAAELTPRPLGGRFAGKAITGAATGEVRIRPRPCENSTLPNRWRISF